MTNRPKKQSDIVLIGNGPLIKAVYDSLRHTKVATMHLSDATKVHFLNKNVVAHEGEKVGAKAFFIVVPNQYVIPNIRGLEQTSYIALGEGPKHPIAGEIVIYGKHEHTINHALNYIEQGHSVSIHCPSDYLLDLYDIAVQDALTRHLKKVGVKIHLSHKIIASRTVNDKTNFITSNGENALRHSCDSLLLEPFETTIPDIGLNNIKGHPFRHDLPVEIYKRLIIVNNPNYLLSLDDAMSYSRILLGKRTKRPVSNFARISMIKDSVAFSFGILEQNIANTHVGYKKSVIKIPSQLNAPTGFIKVMTTLSGKIIGISGIVPSEYSSIGMLESFVRNKLKINQLIKMISVHDDYIDAYYEIFGELSR